LGLACLRDPRHLGLATLPHPTNLDLADSYVHVPRVWHTSYLGFDGVPIPSALGLACVPDPRYLDHG